MFALVPSRLGREPWLGPGRAAGSWAGQVSLMPQAGGCSTYATPSATLSGSINSSEHNSPLAASALSSPSPVISRPSF